MFTAENPDPEVLYAVVHNLGSQVAFLTNIYTFKSLTHILLPCHSSLCITSGEDIHPHYTSNKGNTLLLVAGIKIWQMLSALSQ